MPSFRRSPGQRRSFRPEAAFTLVETVLAIGIVAFAMTAILGLVPVGLSNFRDAIRCSTESQIVQAVAGELSRTDYDKLNEFERYFDVEGRETTSNDAIYSVVVRLRTLEAADLSSASARTVVIEVSNPRSRGLANRHSLVLPPR